ncbi:MAG: SIS domain-containing protein [bacterium]|nr:SIS domain-containing protein [bacterium]
MRCSIAESVYVKQALADSCAEAIAQAAGCLIECFRSGHKALLFGNGGSASDAQHIAAEWVGRYVDDRPALPALALTANSSDFTAIGNDFGFEHTFARLVEAHGHPGDVAVALSTSGNSPNVMAAVELARERGLVTLGLLGKGGGKLASMVDYSITVPSQDTARIQESHITIGHIFCEFVDAALFPKSPST